MGDRGQVHIIDTGVYLYTHYGGTNLPEIVRRALARRERWDDPEYLTRIIFCGMVKPDFDGELGYGIGTERHGDAWRQVKINCKRKTIKVDNGLEISFEEFIARTYY